MSRLRAFLLVVVLLLSQVVYIGYESQPVAGSAAVTAESNLSPVIEIVPDVSSGKAPLEVQFDGDAWDEDGLILSLEWDFEGDGIFEDAKSLTGIERPMLKEAVKQGLKKHFVYTKPGIYHALVRATDDKNESAVSSVTIQVYSDRPWLDVTTSNKDDYPYMARAGYEAFFKDGIADNESVKFQIRDAWISYKIRNQVFGDVNKTKGVPSGNQIVYQNVFSDIDVKYTVYEDLLLEEFIVYKKMPLSFIDQEFTIHGVEYVFNEDGSIGFYNGETLVFSIPKPVMYELNNPQEKSYGLHYEIIEEDNTYILRKIIDDQEWLKKAKYPVVIDGTTSGEIADPWEQQGLTPYGQYFENLNEYVDPMTGHLTIRQTDYYLSGRGLDLSVTRVYSTVVAYKEEENEPGEYIPIATYMEAPTDLGCGWSLDFPWLELRDGQPGKYMHLPRGVQVKTNFQNGVWVNEKYGFTMYQRADMTYVRYRDDGIQEEFDTEGRIISITDLNGNVLTFTYANDLLYSITDTVGRVLTFTYAYDKLVNISDGVRTTTYSYSGDKLVAMTDPLGRVTTYDYLAENSFLITGVHYPTGGFSSYEYSVVLPDNGKLAPYKSADNTEGELFYYMAKVDSADTVTWSSPRDMSEVTISAGRPCTVQRDDGTFVMYFKDKYVWTETVWKCQGGDCWEEIITHTEYWIKRSASADQHHWSTPQNVIQVKSTTGNPVVIEKQNDSYIMYYKDKYVWTEENCYWDRIRKEWVCETITHTEYWIYRRTSTDGVIWGSPVKVEQTVLSVNDVSTIQKQDSTFLMCYTDKVGSSFYIRQKTSTDGVTWSSPSNVILVNSQTGDPALLQRDSGTVYLAYRKGSNIFAISNSGGGWSSPVQTTAVAQGNPALLDLITDIVLIYKGTDGYYYRISSPDGSNWSSPSLIAPNKPITNPSTMIRKDRTYRVTAQYLSTSAADLVKVLEFSYEGDSKIPWSSDVLIRDAQTLQSSMHFEYDSKGRTIERIFKDAQGLQTQKIVYTYNGKDKVVRQDVYAGTSTEISYSAITGYDDYGNIVYTRGPEGAENFCSYANTSSQDQFIDSKGVPVTLFSNQFYSNSVPSDCHSLLVGEAFINNGKVQEVYHKYDSNGNLIETKTLFPTRDYAVFSGTFDETGQTSFTFDLTGLTITDGILVISSIPVPTPETLYETNSEPGKGWQNTGTWEGKYFKADYFRCAGGPPDPDCYDGETKIGPFEHYPGSPNYTGYTTWIEDNLQYVKTSYSAVVNEYPTQVDYRINTSSWTVITDNLGSGTTSITIPAFNFLQGSNTLQFEESNTYPTKFEWTLYIDQASVPEAYTTSFTYDTYGNMTSITDTMGNSTFLGYDNQYHAYLTSIINALNQTKTATYDFTTGLVTSLTDAKGNKTSYQYDILGRITKRINPDLTEKEAVYDDLTNSATIYDELDHKIIYYYDGLNRVTKTEWYLSSTYLEGTYTYNYLNKVETRTDPGGHVYAFEYDSQGRLIRCVNTDSTYREIQYDDTTNTISVIDENQHKKEHHYNWNGLLLWAKEYTDPVTFYLTEYTYDSAGNLTSLTDAQGNTTTYLYDSLFGVTEVTFPDLTTEIYSYNAFGSIKQKTDPGGTTVFTYNSIYQLTDVTYPDSSVISFLYDENGNRTMMTDPAGQTTYTYDERNRLISDTRTISGVPYTVQYTYDAVSELTAITYPDQSTITHEYDDLGRLTAIPGYAEFTYNPDSLPVTASFDNNTVTTYGYDACHRPTTIQTQKYENLLLMNYLYDPVGNITQMSYNRLEGQEWVESDETFSYDWLDRLIEVDGDYGLTYTYDAVGNRLSSNGLTYVYNAMNELTSISDGTQFTYDDKGNVLTKSSGGDTWSYSYGTKNQLIQVEKNQQVLGQYTYDGDGKRIQKTEWVESLQDYQTILYVYSGSKVIYEKNVDTGKTATHVYGPAGRVAKIVDGFKNYYHTDHLGSTRLVTDESGNVVTTADYSPFGEDTVTGDKDVYLYNGKEKDATDLYYYGVRYYDPGVGRFLTRDPLSGDLMSPQTLNQYVYCLNNPLKYIDPKGMAADKMNLQYVILPDGTISHELADLINKLNQALGNLSEEEWAKITEYLHDTNKETKIASRTAALLMILDAAGIKYGYDESTEKYYLTLGTTKFYFEFYNFNMGLWGEIQGGDNESIKSIVFADWISSVEDLYMTIGHELIHAYMIGYHGDTIASIEEYYGKDVRVVYVELISYDWQFNMLNKVPGVSDYLKTTIEQQYKKYSHFWEIIENNPK